MCLQYIDQCTVTTEKINKTCPIILTYSGITKFFFSLGWGVLPIICLKPHCVTSYENMEYDRYMYALIAGVQFSGMTVSGGIQSPYQLCPIVCTGHGDSRRGAACLCAFVALCYCKLYLGCLETYRQLLGLKTR